MNFLRLNLLLLAAVIGCALFLVHVQYQSRVLYTALDRAKVQARQLSTDHERLQVEVRAQAAPSRIEAIAREQWNMRTVTPAITEYVVHPSKAADISQSADTTAQQGPGT